MKVRLIDKASSFFKPEMLVNKIKSLEDRVYRLVNQFPQDSHVLGKRRKRGLFNSVGEGLSILFGVATDDKLDEVRRVVNEINVDNILFQKTISSVTEKNRQKINDIVDSINNIIDTTSDLENRTYAIESSVTAMFALQATTSHIAYIEEEIKNHFDGIRLAIKGIVSDKLLPRRVLKNILTSIKNQGLHIHEQDTLIDYFYEIMTVLYAPKALLVLIPIDFNNKFVHIE